MAWRWIALLAPVAHVSRPPMAQPSLFGVALSDGWRSFQRVGWTFVGAFVVWGIVALAVVSLVSAIFGGWTGQVIAAV